MNEELPILIVEDNDDDVAILRMALRKAGFNHPLHISPDGADAVAFLTGAAPYTDRENFKFPRIIITDLKMPGMNGFELLTWLQTHPHCNVIPRLVLSSSDQDQDVQRAYQLGASSYLVKPSTFEKLTENLKLVFAYWNMVAKPVPPLQ